MTMTMNRLTRRPAAVWTLLLAALVVCSATSAYGQPRPPRRGVRGEREREEDKGKRHDLREWGDLRPVRGEKGTYEFWYKKREKGKLRTRKVLVKVPEEKEKCSVYQDVRIRLNHLKAKDRVLLFGKPVAHEVYGGRGGGLGAVRSGKDYQVQNTRVLLAGDVDTFALDETYTNRKLPGVIWLRAEVQDTAGGLKVLYKGNGHRVNMAKRAPLVKRVKLVKRELERFRKSTKKRKVYLHADAVEEKKGSKKKKKTDDRKKSARDNELKTYRAGRVIILDPRLLKTAYPLIWGG